MRGPPQWGQVQGDGGLVTTCCCGGRLKAKARWMRAVTLVRVMEEVGLRKP